MESTNEANVTFEEKPMEPARPIDAPIPEPVMEPAPSAPIEKKPKGSKGIVVIFVILIALLLGTVGYIVYDQVFAESRCNKCNVDTKEKTDSKYTKEELYKKYLESVKKRDITTTAYFAVEDSNSPSKVTAKNFILGSDNIIYELDSNETNKNTVSIPGAECYECYDGYAKGFSTGIDKVIAIYEADLIVEEHESARSMFVIKEDGSVYVIRDVTASELKLEKVDATNIVSTYERRLPYSYIYLVDIEGNLIEIK